MTNLFSTIETELADSIWDSEILGTNEQEKVMTFCEVAKETIC